MSASAAATSIASLRQLLQQRFPGATPIADRTAGAVATGIGALDRALPGGGFPRGRISVWAPGSGVTAVLSAAARVAVQKGERAAWIDAAGVMTGDAWGGPVLVRPEGDRQALECAEELVRSGGFALVVLAGARTADTERVRLSRAVREGGTALLTLSAEGFLATVRVRSWVPRGGFEWRRNALGEPMEVEALRLHVRATALGWSRDAVVRLPVASHDLRLSVESALGDRRGAAG